MASAWILSAIILLGFFPISLGIEARLDIRKFKADLSLYLYTKIKVIKGTLTFKKKRFLMNLGKKEFEVPYKKLFGGNMPKGVLFGYTLTEATALLEIGSKENNVAPVSAGIAFSAICSALSGAVKTLFPASKNMYVTKVFEGEDIAVLNFNLSVLMNVALIAVSIAKIITGKIRNGKRKKK